MILRVFIDETSSHEDATQPLMLAGCVSTSLKWDRFNRQWRKILKEHKISHIRWHDLLHGNGECAGLGNPERVKIIEEAEKCIFSHLEFGFCTVLHRTDFENYRKTDGSSLGSMLDSDYGVSFRVAMGFLHSVLPMIVQERYPQVYVLAEDGDQNSGAVNQIFKQYKTQYQGKDRIVKHAALVDKNEFPGTQAADIRAAGYLMQENAGQMVYQEIAPSFKNVTEWVGKNQLPWFRLPLNDGVLMDMRDGLILSKRSFGERFGNLLSKYFWDSSFSGKQSS